MTSSTGLRLIGLLALLLLVLAGALVARGRARRLPGFPYGRPPLPAAEYAALAARPGWSGVSIEGAGDHGPALRGLLRRPKAARGPWVLFFQGNSNRLLGEGQEFLEALAGQEDVGLALFAWRGFDGSGGEPGRDALVLDASTMVRWLRGHGAAGAPLHLVGFSLGTMPAVAAALEAEQGPGAQPARSLTLLAPFTSLRMYEAGRLRRWTTAEEWDLLPLLGQVKMQTLVVQGTADQTLPVAMGREVAARIPGARFLEVPGQGHVPLLLDERALAAVRAVVLAP